LQGQVKRLGTSVGMMCPTLCGWRTADELTPLRVWDKHLPGRILGARVRLQGRVPIEAIVFRLTQDGRFLHSDLRACQARSWDLRLEAACILP
jgi:hypothetical protein